VAKYIQGLFGGKGTDGGRGEGIVVPPYAQVWGKKLGHNVNQKLTNMEGRVVTEKSPSMT